MSIIDELERLADRRRAGQLDEGAFRAEKQRVLAEARQRLAPADAADEDPATGGSPWGGAPQGRSRDGFRGWPRLLAGTIVALVVVALGGAVLYLTFELRDPVSGFPTATELARDLAAGVSVDAEVTEVEVEAILRGTEDTLALNRLRRSFGASAAVVLAPDLQLSVEVFPDEATAREAARLLTTAGHAPITCGRAVVTSEPPPAPRHIQDRLERIVEC